VLGRSVADDPLAIRSRLGHVPEDDALLPNLTAVASVVYCGQLAGLRVPDAVLRAHDVLSFVGLDEARYRTPETFSTGMRQKLKLAQALVHGPDLLVLDEPTNGLDPKARDQMLTLIADLGHARGLSLIVSSHLLPDIERTCDAVVALDAGELAGAGPLGAWRGPVHGPHTLRIKGDRLAFAAALRAAGIRCDVGDEEMVAVDLVDVVKYEHGPSER
jgi:ABC-2 type transport system ATP-binding protein